MSDKRIPVGPGTAVLLTFSLSLADGSEIDSTGDRPARFEFGDGNFLPGFEQALVGMRAGEMRDVVLSPDQAFGLHQEDNLQRIPRDRFQSNMALSEGLMMSFADAQNAELPGVIAAVDDKYVDVDFNHPLAGKEIHFSAHVISVVRVTNDIIRVG